MYIFFFVLVWQCCVEGWPEDVSPCPSMLPADSPIDVPLKIRINVVGRNSSNGSNNGNNNINPKSSVTGRNKWGWVCSYCATKYPRTCIDKRVQVCIPSSFLSTCTGYYGHF